MRNGRANKLGGVVLASTSCWDFGPHAASNLDLLGGQREECSFTRVFLFCPIQ